MGGWELLLAVGVNVGAVALAFGKLLGTVTTGFAGVHRRQDIANGRLDRHDAKLDDHGQRLATVEERTR